MRYLLDSNTCIVFLKQSNLNIQKSLERLSDNDIAVCSVVKA